jgi:ATP-dependent DNA helicase DinG
MGRVFKKLEKRKLPFPLFKLERSTSNAIDRFKESGNAGTSGAGVLFAAGALWEGIDIPGDALSMLIIVKLPFAAPDRVSEYEQTQYPNFMAYLESVLTPEMLVKLKQGFGRLLRLETDTGVVAILDIRAYFDAAYYNPIIETLPPCRVTGDIDEVVWYLRFIKGVEYFE